MAEKDINSANEYPQIRMVNRMYRIYTSANTPLVGSFTSETAANKKLDAYKRSAKKAPKKKEN